MEWELATIVTFLSSTLRGSVGTVAQDYSHHGATAINIKISLNAQMQCAVHHSAHFNREAVTLLTSVFAKDVQEINKRYS